MSEPKKLSVEVTSQTERFVDVYMEGDLDLSLSVRSLAPADGKETPEVLFCIERDVVDENDAVVEQQAVVFPVEQWEDIKRMGDAAVATYREKFAGPS